MNYEQAIVEHYHQRLAAVCRAVRTATSTTVPSSTSRSPPPTSTPDANHLSADGQKKYAELVWQTFFA